MVKHCSLEMVLTSPQRAAALWTNPVCEMKLYKMQWEPWSLDRRGTRAPHASLKGHLFSEDHLVQVFSKQKPLSSRVTLRVFWLEKVHGPIVSRIEVLTIKGVEAWICFQIQIKDHLLCSADSSSYFSSQQKPGLQSWSSGTMSCLWSQLLAQGMYLAQLGSCLAIQLQQGCCKADQPGTALPDTRTCTRDCCMLEIVKVSSEYCSWAQKSCGCYSNCYFTWHIFWSGQRQLFLNEMISTTTWKEAVMRWGLISPAIRNRTRGNGLKLCQEMLEKLHSLKRGPSIRTGSPEKWLSHPPWRHWKDKQTWHFRTWFSDWLGSTG